MTGLHQRTRRRRTTLRFAVVAAVFAGALAFGTGAATPATGISQLLQQHEPICESHASLCRDAFKTPGDEYVGHDEPSVAFRSSEPGSGNDITYELRLPREPPIKPRNDGSGGTWTFELRPTFWFGLTLCDTSRRPSSRRPAPPTRTRTTS
jgi:hypothetical protein